MSASLCPTVSPITPLFRTCMLTCFPAASTERQRATMPAARHPRHHDPNLMRPRRNCHGYCATVQVSQYAWARRYRDILLSFSRRIADRVTGHEDDRGCRTIDDVRYQRIWLPVADIVNPMLRQYGRGSTTAEEC